MSSEERVAGSEHTGVPMQGLSEHRMRKDFQPPKVISTCGAKRSHSKYKPHVGKKQRAKRLLAPRSSLLASSASA